VFRPIPRWSALSALLLALLLALTACGGSGSPSSAASGSSTPAAAQWPATVTGKNGPVTLKAKPVSIVSLSATATEMLYAIDAGTQVKAVDSTSNYPSTAPITKLSAFTPNAEAIAAYKPDLVVLTWAPCRCRRCSCRPPRHSTTATPSCRRWGKRPGT
jgi:iron complex transport system substrate-binding protein